MSLNKLLAVLNLMSCIFWCNLACSQVADCEDRAEAMVEWLWVRALGAGVELAVDETVGG